MEKKFQLETVVLQLHRLCNSFLQKKKKRKKKKEKGTEKKRERKEKKNDEDGIVFLIKLDQHRTNVPLKKAFILFALV